MKLKWLILFLIFVILAPTMVSAAPTKWARPQYIKTYVPPKHKHTHMMKEAFERWSKASNRKFKFYYVSTPKIAHIRVNFCDVIPYDEWSLSTQEQYVRRGKKLRSTIYIASMSHDGDKLSKDEIFTLMLHEVGHSLGLPHTKNKLSVMYPTEDVSQEILPTDIARLYSIYGIKTR